MKSTRHTFTRSQRQSLQRSAKRRVTYSLKNMSGRKLNILLIDDERDERILFDEALSDLSLDYNLVQVHTASNEILSDCLPVDIIFLDINMPGKNGIDFLKELKADAKYKHIPIVIYSNSASEKDIEAAYCEGAHFFLVKPYAHINYLESLRKIFSVNWKNPQPIPLKDNFVINLAFA
jgi:CheY-like chemotaxis protein